MQRTLRAVLLTGMVVAGLWAPTQATAATLIDFEAFVELDVPTAPGVTFTNALVLTSGAIGGSLNEIQFPPRSGFNVAGDVSGPVTLTFSTPIQSFSGWFTYASPLSFTAFNGVNPLSQLVTLLPNNLGTQHQISIVEPGGITRLEIFGSAGGGTFAMDDLEFDAALAPIPEPASVLLVAAGLGAVVRRRRR